MNKYIKGLSEKDKQVQLKQLERSKRDYKLDIFTDRKDLSSFKEKPSSYVLKVKKITGLPVNFDKLADKLTRTQGRRKMVRKGFEEIYDKGRAAYYSSGSRPNQTPESWGKGRLASVLVGGPARKIDIDIVRKYDIPLLK